MLDPELTALLSEFGIAPATAEAIVTATIYLTIASLVAAIPTGVIAKRKGRSVSAWVIFELCVPLLPLVIVWLLPARKDK